MWSGLQVGRILSVCVAMLAAAAFRPGITHGQNLLENPGFEGQDGFSLPGGSCAGGGNYDYFYNCIPEVLSPTFWTPFWNEGPKPNEPVNNYRRPEFKVIAKVAPFLNPPRIHDGYRACQHFGFYGAIDAGYYQQVNVTPGQAYRFNYWAHAWSSCDSDPFSSGGGCAGFPNDQVTFRAGIDPTGGTDYKSSNIVWGPGGHIYDQYEQVPDVSAVAQSSTITVFIRSVYLWNYKHNDSYIDKAELVLDDPQITLSVATIERDVRLGEPLSDDTFTVRNTGGGSMNYGITDNVNWLSVSPSSGSSSGEADTIIIDYNVAGLPMGEHQATISVSSGDASNSPQSLAVTLFVLSAPGDMDGDLDVDQEDFGLFQACFTGVGAVQSKAECQAARLDHDDDVDSADVAIFHGCMTGADIPAGFDCAD